MALSANTILEVQNGGSDTNGGGFVAGASGTDWSRQTSPQYSVTDGVTAGTTTITSATAGFGADVVGNIMYVQGGSGSVVAGWYQITARANSTTITVDRSTGLTAGTGVTLKIGGALASPGQAAAIATVSGMSVFIKYHASPYVATTVSPNVPGGIVSGTANTAYIGYDTTRAFYVFPVQANRPTFQLGSGVTGVALFGNLNANYLVQSMILDGNSQTSSRGYQSSGEIFYVKAMNCTASGLIQNSQGRAILCEATACTANPISFSTCLWCVSHDNTLTSPTNQGAFQGSGPGSIAYGCISYGNNCLGFSAPYETINCIAYGNASHGFDVGNNPGTMINCISEGNGTGGTGYGFRSNTGLWALINCASYGNASGRAQAGGKLLRDLDSIVGSGSFFNNAASADFTINNIAGAGAMLRAGGFPTSFPAPALNNYSDVGPLQHQDTGAGFLFT